MAELFRLPKMGQTMTEATILRWLKQEGDSFEGWESVVSVMTDKIDMEVEPQITGTLRKILAPEGAVVPLGHPLAIIGAPNEDISALLAAADTPGPTASATPVLAGGSNGHGETGSGSRAADAGPPASTLGIPSLGEIPSVSPRARELAAEGGIDWRGLQLSGTGFEGMVVERDVRAAVEHTQPDAPIRATPLAARIAADTGVSLQGVVGTGPAGKVQADDVRRLEAARAAAPRLVTAQIAAKEIALRGMRRTIATRLSQSYQQAVHVPMRVEVDMSAAAELRRQLRPELEAGGARLTYTDLIAVAIARALFQQPLLNATLEDDLIRIHPHVNLGIAVALQEGLVVPVVERVEAQSILQVSRSIQDVGSRARAGRLAPSEMAGGTFTLTNLGQFGVDSFDPIINPPQVAILGTGRIADRVVAIGGAPAVRPMMTATLVFDHRAVDGAPAAAFLSVLREQLENPTRLLL
jgi:pyruvate dehydrogenase E2 component (dihydrolipoamide acetyltransferase)